MGYLLHIFLAFGIQALGEALDPEPLLPLAAGLALLPLPHLLALAVRIAALSGRFRTAERLGRLLGIAAPLGFAVLVLGCDWIDWIASRLGRAPTLSWPGPALALSLAPFVILQLLAIDAQSRAQATHAAQRRHARAFQLRLFASSLTPVGIYLALTFLIGLREDVRVHVERVALLNALFVGLLLVLLALFLPRLLAATWETRPMPLGPQRALLGAVAQQAGFRARELLVWRTGHSMANAAIVGLFPSTRIVLFSDSLLSLLGPRELAAVYGHEIGHAARRHVTIFLAWALAFFLGGDLIASAVAPDDFLVGSTIVAGAVVAWLLVFGWLSRRFELEADLYSLELLGDPGGLIGALERLGGRLRDVAGWRHFSTADRVRFLERAWSEEGFAQRFRRRLRVLSWIGAVLAALALAGEGWSLVQRLDEDRVYAEMGLGRYASAYERARAAELDEDLIALCAIGAALAEDAQVVPAGTVVAALSESLTGAEDRGDVARTLGLAQLAVLRGRTDFMRLVRELDELLEIEDEPHAHDLDELRQRFVPELWQEPFPLTDPRAPSRSPG